MYAHTCQAYHCFMFLGSGLQIFQSFTDRNKNPEGNLLLYGYSYFGVAVASIIMASVALTYVPAASNEGPTSNVYVTGYWLSVAPLIVGAVMLLGW